MAIVTPRSQRWRLLAVHAALIGFIVVTLLPLLMIVSISLRPILNRRRLASASVATMRKTIEAMAQANA